MPPLALPPDYPRQHLLQGVECALAREGHILSRGEQIVVGRWMALPGPAASLYARLLSRQGTVFRTDRLQYADVPQPHLAAASLVQAGLAHPRGLLALPQILSAHTVPELKAACAAQGLQSSGRRSDLVARLEQTGDRTCLPGPCIGLRHRHLFRRLLRVYLGDHGGDLTKVVLEASGVQSFPGYTPTLGPGLFRNRRALQAYEQALAILTTERDEQSWADLAPLALRRLAEQPQEPTARRRFDARRLYDRAALRAIRAVERQDGALHAVPLYQFLLAHHTQWPAEATQRLALCLGRAGHWRAGADLCDAARPPHGGTPEGLALERTGRRLAKRAGRPWEPASALREAPSRRIQLDQVPSSPPRFETPNGAVPVEAAVVAHLASGGRSAFHAESAPWTTLFGLLFYDALFSEVEGMLPSAMMTGPLDLYTPDFSDRRASEVADALNCVARGGAADRIREVGASHLGERIAGVYWDLMPLEDLAALADHIGPRSLHALMRLFAQDPRSARAGMPDLIVLPGSGGRLPESLVLIEVKGPGDQLRDRQRCWHHSLLEAGLAVEVWWIEDARAG